MTGLEAIAARLKRLSLRARLVIGVIALALVGLVVADVATYASLRSFLIGREDSALDAAHVAVERLGSFDSSRILSAIAPGDYIQARNPDGHVVVQGELPQFPNAAVSPPPKLPASISLPSGGEGPDAVRYFTVPAQAGSGSWRVRAWADPGSGFTFVLAAPLHEVNGTLHRLLLVELLVTVAVLAALAAIGLWVVRRALRPLDAIGDTAAAIAAGDLSRRVERAEPHTEVGRLGLALNTMLSHIEASDRRLRRFVADASHELRTPLTAVRAYAELFSRGAESRPGDLARSMTGIGRESERMSVLVDDLLLLARLDEGRPLEQEEVRLDEVVAEAVDSARAVEPERPIDLDADEVVVSGDRDRLRQVADNLLANARSHTPAGTPVHVRVRPEDGTAIFEVADEGEGMAPEDLERVFERFYRADPSRSRANGGSGLGLSIVAAVAEAHGGRATAASEPGEGALFRVTLPRVAAAPTPPQPAPAEIQAATSR